MPFTLEDEGRSVSPHSSPGPVESHEALLRIVYEPEHIVNGRLIPAAIPAEDLKSRGYSTDRCNYKDELLMRERAGTQMARKPEERREKRISRFGCLDMRNIQIEEGRRDLIIVDEIKEDERINIAHASLYSAYRKGKAAIKELKQEMLEYMQNLYSFEDIFGTSVVASDAEGKGD